ncbi:unnamed protein product [Prorocentrum cordatum]|uniref:Uncharacterized protein n=1 Tax=Prorocentrum cordatum TaxID=2364126 RepID=A0ABN9VIG6_9DINO|nr:unnamed protein product [Polarella glacialis]
MPGVGGRRHAGELKSAQQDLLAQIGRMQSAQVSFERRGVELGAAKSRIAELESSLRDSATVAERRRLELEASQLARQQGEALLQEATCSLRSREEELQAAQQERTLATQALAASQRREQDSRRQLAQLQQQVEACSRSSAEIEGVLRAAQAREARLAQLEGAISAAAAGPPGPSLAEAPRTPRLPQDKSTPHLLECGGPSEQAPEPGEAARRSCDEARQELSSCSLRLGGASTAPWSPAPSARPLHSGLSSPESSPLQPRLPSSCFVGRAEGGGASVAAAAPPSTAPRLAEPRRPSAMQTRSVPQLPAQPRPRSRRSPRADKDHRGTSPGLGGGSWEAEGLQSLLAGAALALRRASPSGPRAARQTVH